jgi:hypothetical protein
MAKKATIDVLGNRKSKIEMSNNALRLQWFGNVFVRSLCFNATMKLDSKMAVLCVKDFLSQYASFTAFLKL